MFKALAIEPDYMQGPNPTEPASHISFFCGSLQEYLIKADGLHSNQEPLLNWFIHLVLFAFVEEKRTTKPVFASVLVKSHLV
jgi:hypothetical protein